MSKKILLTIAKNFDYIVTAGKEYLLRPKENLPEGTIPMTPKNLDNVIYSIDKTSLSQAKKEALHRAIWDEAKKRAIKKEVNVRVAHEGDTIYCDLGHNGFVRISGKGIKIVDSCPVAFLRPATMQALPIPDLDTSSTPQEALKGLWDLTNVEAKDRRVVAAWLMSLFQHEGTKAALLLEGAHGAAKTTTLIMLARVLDPHIPRHVALSKAEKDLYIFARNRLVAAFDNVSDVKAATSDILCQILSGGATSARKLYTDGDEFVISAKASLILNGITTGVVRGDLLDRTLKMELPELSGKRRTEKELNALFVQRHPAILGALLRVVHYGLGHPVELPDDLETGRLVDFAHWSYTCAPGLGLMPEKLVNRICENQRNAREEVMSTDDVADFIRTLLNQNRGTWEGIATDLYAEFGIWAADRKFRLSASYPASVRAMTGWLKRAAPLLRSVGIRHTDKRIGSKRLIVITRISKDD